MVPGAEEIIMQNIIKPQIKSLQQSPCRSLESQQLLFHAYWCLSNILSDKEIGKSFSNEQILVPFVDDALYLSGRQEEIL